MEGKNIPAFPRPLGEGGYKYNESQTGMTLRDYFAGQAIAGLLASGEWGCDCQTAEQAYGMADSMFYIKDKEN